MADGSIHAVARAVQIWLTKPQVANRRLFGCKVLSGDAEDVCRCADVPASMRRLLVPRSAALAPAEEGVEWLPDRRAWRFAVECSREGHRAEYEVRAATGADEEPLAVVLLRLELRAGADEWLFSEGWFAADLADRLAHWHDQSVAADAREAPIVAPMALVDVEKYLEHQRRLKSRYARELIATWPEKTNAEKFVFEDVAIAAYLLALWDTRHPGPDPVHFADLGCGNGLLVFFLNSEGVSGVGLDVRRRGIWGHYPPAVRANLLEVSLDPSSPKAGAHLPAGTNWLLGNHSDELTPWLPVLAARHSPSCALFLLPCCPHDLFGKFAVRSGTESRYRTFLRFVGEAGERCGFRMARDAMRIPSTRRACWVGLPEAEEDGRGSRLAAVDAFVESRRSEQQFCPRPCVEPVRNCSRVPREVRERICDLVFTELLRRGEGKRPRLEEGRGERWNAGGRLSLAEATALLDNDDRAALKAQNGGLQTLLRNHHQAFEVRGGTVVIRRQFKAGGGRAKTSQCWMMGNHPDGCPRTAAECPFRHGEETGVDPASERPE